MTRTCCNRVMSVANTMPSPRHSGYDSILQCSHCGRREVFDPAWEAGKPQRDKALADRNLRRSAFGLPPADWWTA